ncbi:hypothetical protein L345_17382, partial [Ophiophagus hannah]
MLMSDGVNTLSCGDPVGAAAAGVTEEASWGQGLAEPREELQEEEPQPEARACSTGRPSRHPKAPGTEQPTAPRDPLLVLGLLLRGLGRGGELNPLVDDQSLTANAICQINRFIVNTLKDGRRVVVLMEMEVLRPGHAVPAKIGNPVPYTEGKAPSLAGPWQLPSGRSLVFGPGLITAAFLLLLLSFLLMLLGELHRGVFSGQGGDQHGITKPSRSSCRWHSRAWNSRGGTNNDLWPGHGGEGGAMGIDEHCLGVKRCGAL